MSGSQDKNPHSGHRERLRDQFLNYGLDGLSDYNALELLLFYVYPRRDTNLMAHKLLDAFGSLAGVLDADPEALIKTGGLTKNGAALLKLVVELDRKAQISKTSRKEQLTTTEKCGEYLLPFYYGLTEETVYVLALDGKCRSIGCKKLFSGSLSAASVSIREVVDYALRTKAASIVLSHNHTSGIAVPSQEDVAVTKQLAQALLSVNVLLADHIVVADGRFASMIDLGLYRPPALY